MRKISILLTILLAACSCSKVRNPLTVKEYPPIWPDYKFVTIPLNIAPMNFGITDSVEYKVADVKVFTEDGKMVMSSRGRTARFPTSRWHKVLSDQAGSKLVFHVSLKSHGWTSYAPFYMLISKDSIDYGLTYRLIPPGYQSFGHMGIYERCLENFRQRTLLDTRMINSECINCHTENKGNPEYFSVHIRGRHSATLLRTGSSEEYLNTRTDSTIGSFVYPYWHPSGKYIAYSINTTRQSFYSSSDKMLEVYDENSDVIVYCPETHEVLRPAFTNRKDKFESMPAFSPDGKKLYYCVTNPGIMPRDIKNVRYSLCSLDFDPETGKFGDHVDTLVSAYVYGKSFVFPRPSYDGKYILLSAADYGTFLINHKESDLWLYDISTGTCHEAGDINSPDVDSFHNWSTNSCWAVITSRREDGLYTRLYISHFNKEKGSFDKAFLLPQKNPAEYYQNLIYSYNTPDFTVSPVKLDPQKASRKILSDERTNVKASN